MRIGSRMFTASPLDFLRQGGVKLTQAVRHMEMKVLEIRHRKRSMSSDGGEG